MRYVLDACIAVAAMKPREPLHAEAKRRIERLQAGEDELVVPSLFTAEVASALTRNDVNPDRVAAFLSELLAEATVVTVGPKLSWQIARVAMRTRLRGGDAAYVWLASREGVALVTADDEIIARASALCTVERP
jgi:predicted nucleic acid-binding protein